MPARPKSGGSHHWFQEHQTLKREGSMSCVLVTYAAPFMNLSKKHIKGLLQPLLETRKQKAGSHAFVCILLNPLIVVSKEQL